MERLAYASRADRRKRPEEKRIRASTKRIKVSGIPENIRTRPNSSRAFSSLCSGFLNINETFYLRSTGFEDKATAPLARAQTRRSANRRSLSQNHCETNEPQIKRHNLRVTQSSGEKGNRPERVPRDIEQSDRAGLQTKRRSLLRSGQRSKKNSSRNLKPPTFASTNQRPFP